MKRYDEMMSYAFTTARAHEPLLTDAKMGDFLLAAIRAGSFVPHHNIVFGRAGSAADPVRTSALFDMYRNPAATTQRMLYTVS